MTNGQRSFLCARRMGAVVLAAGIFLCGGCGTVPDPVGGPLGGVQLPPVKAGSRAEAEAFKKRVQNDAFPSASQALVGNADPAASAPR